MRVGFFGSPDFALPSLEAVVAAGHEVVLAVSQPAKPVGRSGVPADPPVARRARELGLAVFQPPTLKDEGAFARLAGTEADLFVVVAYGKILAQRVLDLPRLGCVNVHGSVLPRWRGASPVQAALLSGDAETGVSIMRMEAGMDTGPVFAVARTPIGGGEDAGVLSGRLAREGAALLVATLPRIADGTAVPVAQDDALATLCPKIRREDGQADFSRPAVELVRRLRAFTPWPGLFAFRAGKRVKLLQARESDGREGAAPGEVLAASDEIVVACGRGAL
ncbi:MAG: methionyl-tRNA formyltransferase, partial [Thermoanaerobaculia bacterium]|nr:methionyl-tRNA formyltransferase [Thermoanaerobaculia bacterium]